MRRLRIIARPRAIARFIRARDITDAIRNSLVGQHAPEKLQGC